MTAAGDPTAALPLSAIRHWVFDMDGTLTVAEIGRASCRERVF